MAGHDEDDDLFADLYGDEEENQPQQVPAPFTESAPVPVPPPSVAPPLAPEANVGGVAAQLSAATGKAHDPRLPPPTNETVVSQQKVTSEVEQQALPEMPQMPAMPIPGPPAPSYNQKEDGKMFIGGLNWETTDESLKAYFEQFGSVTECMVMRDGATGRSRGFGFLTFADASSVTTVVSKEHFLDGKIIDPKRAVPRDEQEKTAKMFVGGVPPDCDEEQFSQFFGQFGRVVDATLMMDKDTGRPRGFGFVTFDTGEAVERAMVTPFLQINNKTIEVKRATPKGNQDRNARGAGTYNANGGFGGQDGNAAAAAAYGGMTPAMMAQYYQRMQQWMAQMQAMGRGQAAQGMMGMNPMMNPMMMQQMQQMQAQQGQAGHTQYQQQPQQQQQQQQQSYGSQSPYQGNEAQYDDGQSGDDGGDSSRPPIDAPSGPAAGGQYRAPRGGYQDRGRYDRGGRGGYQDRGGRGGRGRGGYRGGGGGQSRFDPYAR